LKASVNWLRRFIPGLALDAQGIADALTRVGLEVESVNSFARDISGLRAAEVMGVKPHPKADKLRLVSIRSGDREEVVVCGARNVPVPGGRVIWAAPGAELPGGFRIEARPVRGVLSPGMLCGEDELGLGEASEGIVILSELDGIVSGENVVDRLGLADDILEVNVTANRPDALSHAGLARDLAAATGATFVWPDDLDFSTPEQTEAAPRAVAVEDGRACPRYQARWVRGLTVQPSPLSVRAQLFSCGIRPINNLVDVTNQVLLDVGHPLHAFDESRLVGAVAVRRARAGESLKTLDGVERVLVADSDVVIADESGPIALAGVMGGLTSEVSKSTTDVLLEAATFEPVQIRRTSKRLGMHTEASHRFERGVDAEGVARAAASAVARLVNLGGGHLVASLDVYNTPPPRRTVTLSLSRLRSLSGLPQISAAEAEAELRKVSSSVGVSQPEGDAVFEVEAPSFRPDILGSEDLIEEVLRFRGYDRVPTRTPVSNARPQRSPEAVSDSVRDSLAASGLREVVTWGFVSQRSLAALGRKGSSPELASGLRVLNPISAEYEVMRTSLLPGLVAAARRNQQRGMSSVAIFEVGPVVLKKPSEGASSSAADQAKVSEKVMAAGLLMGPSAGWLREGPDVDFYDAKGVVERLFSSLGISVAFNKPSDCGFLHPGLSASANLPEGQLLGRVGEIHPNVRSDLGLAVPAFYFECFVDQFPEIERPAAAVPPRFPSASRDISFFIDAEVPAAAHAEAFFKAGQALLEDAKILEDFRDPGKVPEGQKSVLWTLTYRSPERTLTDAEVDSAHQRVLESLKNELGVAVR